MMKSHPLMNRFGLGVLALAFILAGAGVRAAEAQKADPAKVDPIQIARGAKAWAEQCGRCHNIRSPSELGDKEWHVSVTHMQVRANIPGNVIEDIRAFLKSSN